MITFRFNLKKTTQYLRNSDATLWSFFSYRAWDMTLGSEGAYKTVFDELNFSEQLGTVSSSELVVMDLEVLADLAVFAAEIIPLDWHALGCPI